MTYPNDENAVFISYQIAASLHRYIVGVYIYQGSNEFNLTGALE